MEAINMRLNQLEKIEGELYAERQATIQRRQQEDMALQAKRHEEDQNFLARLTARDQEEDVLRRDRRVLARSSLPNTTNVKPPEPVPIPDNLILKRNEVRRSSLPNTAGVRQPGPVPAFDAKTIASSEGARSSQPTNVGANRPGHIATFDAVSAMKIEGRPSSLPAKAGATWPVPAPAFNAQPTTIAKARVKRPLGDKPGQRVKKQRQKEHGQPTTHDSQGRALYTRRSDGKLVYLRCLVQDCGRTDFKTVRALMRHVSDPRYAHKMTGIFKGNSHAIELCGVVAPGEDDLDSSASTKVASSILGDQQSMPIPRSRSGSTAVGSEDRFAKAKLIRDLERISQVPSSPADVELEVKKSRSQQAAELYEGFSSSDSEDDDEAQLLSQFSSSKNDQQTAASNGVASSIRSPTGADFFDAPTSREQRSIDTSLQRSAVADVKEEHISTPPASAEQSANLPNPTSPVAPSTAPSRAHLGPEIETDPEDAAESIAARGKRLAPKSSSTPRQPEKRPRVSDGLP